VVAANALFREAAVVERDVLQSSSAGAEEERASVQRQYRRCVPPSQSRDVRGGGCRGCLHVN
jgi:hypothetical protein